MKDKINFDKFLEASNSLEIKMGMIVSAETFKENKPNVYKLIVSFGDSDTRTVITSIGNDYSTDSLVNKLFPFVTNLEAVKQYGILSEAMIMIPMMDNKPLASINVAGATII